MGALSIILGDPRGARTFGFMGGMPSGTTFSRASAAQYFGSGLTLATAANDVPRFAYDPAGGGLQGLLNEPAATNSIRNASASGASVGTPGTPPTNWSFTSSINNITRTVVGTGTEDGIPYLDVRYAGTPSASSSLSMFFEGSALQVPASSGQTWTGSVFLRLVGGSWSNLVGGGINQYVTERDSGGGSVAGSSAVRVPTSAALKTQLFDLSRTLNNVSTVALTGTIGVTYTNGNAIDFTVRIGLPQIVQAVSASSPIVTTSAAVTRAGDVLSLKVPSRIYRTIRIVRVSGVTVLSNVAVSANSYTVPNDPSPLQRVEVMP